MASVGFESWSTPSPCKPTWARLATKTRFMFGYWVASMPGQLAFFAASNACIWTELSRGVIS